MRERFKKSGRFKPQYNVGGVVAQSRQRSRKYTYVALRRIRGNSEDLTDNKSFEDYDVAMAFAKEAVRTRAYPEAVVKGFVEGVEIETIINRKNCV